MTDSNRPEQDAAAASAAGKAPRAKARRARGEATRRRILQATLNVIAREGIRGVTHRAVAAEAGVQLSLTTYYFSDIEQLLKEAFAQFCERMRPDLETLWGDIFAYLDGFGAADLRRVKTREAIAENLARRAGDYIYTQITQKPTGLVVEQIFFTEARLSAELRRMGAEHREQLLRPIVRLCGYFNRRDPQLDAELLLDIITALEYQGVGRNRKDVDKQRIHALAHRQLGWMLGLRRA